MNIDFIKEILMSTSEYWIVSQKTEYMDCMQMKRGDDQIIFISIPQHIKRGLKYEEITLQEVEKLHNSHIDQNIFINVDYPPFQSGVSFNNIYKGYPVDRKIKEFAIKALNLKSNKLYEYKDLIYIEPVNESIS